MAHEYEKFRWASQNPTQRCFRGLRAFGDVEGLRFFGVWDVSGFGMFRV